MAKLPEFGVEVVLSTTAGIAPESGILQLTHKQWAHQSATKKMMREGVVSIFRYSTDPMRQETPLDGCRSDSPMPSPSQAGCLRNVASEPFKGSDGCHPNKTRDLIAKRQVPEPPRRILPRLAVSALSSWVLSRAMGDTTNNGGTSARNEEKRDLCARWLGGKRTRAEEVKSA